MKKTKDFYYREEDIRKLSPEEIIKLFIKEQSYQQTMNVIRTESQILLEKIKTKQKEMKEEINL